MIDVSFEEERRRDRLNRFLRGVAGCGLLFWMVVYGFQVFAASIGESKAVVCASNLHQLAFASLEYAADHDDRLPPADRWLPALRRKQLPGRSLDHLRCIGAHGKDFGYAMASKLSARALSSLPDPAREPLFFDSSLPGLFAHGDLSSLPKPGRHGSDPLFGGSGRYNWIAYADGKVERTPKRRKR